METAERPGRELKRRYRLENQLSIPMEDGMELRIETAEFEERKELARQIEEDQSSEAKYCVTYDDENKNGGEDVEQFKMIYFPKIDSNGDEINHSTVVPYEDSIANGNIIIVDGKVGYYSSNHRDIEYADYEDRITEFAASTLDKILQGD